jgi:hypothetical protein
MCFLFLTKSPEHVFIDKYKVTICCDLFKRGRKSQIKHGHVQQLKLYYKLQNISLIYIYTDMENKRIKDGYTELYLCIPNWGGLLCSRILFKLNLHSNKPLTQYSRYLIFLF